MADRNTVTLSIMGRDYRLSVTPEEEEKLRVCAQIVEAKMKEIHQPGRVFSPDAVAVLAALRIAYDFLNRKSNRSSPCVKTLSSVELNDQRRRP